MEQMNDHCIEYDLSPGMSTHIDIYLEEREKEKRIEAERERERE